MAQPKNDLIKIFPDTGHHYTFLPMAPSKDGRHEQVLALFPNLADSTKRLREFPITEKACLEDSLDWQPLEGCPWIRYRWGHRKMQAPDPLGEITLLGVWLAIESNIGNANRGYMYAVTVPTPEELEAFEKNPSLLPRGLYPAPDVTKLKDVNFPILKIVVGQRNGQNEYMLGEERADAVFDWQEANAKPIDVDLVIDFGNTRTVALALENNEKAGGNLNAICRPIRFLNRSTEYAESDSHVGEDASAIVDSWIVLHEPVFGSDSFTPPVFEIRKFEKDKKVVGGRWFGSGKEVEVLTGISHRVPQMFVELSPVVIGPWARQILSGLDTQITGKNFLSSPKRYAWDTDLVGEMANLNWTMVLNPWHPDRNSRTKIPKLRGEMLRFLPLNGQDWDISNPPTKWERHQRPDPNPNEPCYPRSDALTWTALSIIETAYRQIHSFAWRKNNFQPAPRKLRHVLVTFPSGWTSNELDAYRAKWQKAINIFTLSHLADTDSATTGRGQAPVLMMDMDEAVSSQLPIVFSGIHEMGDQGNNWLELFGRGEPGKQRVRAMTVDIGGGTTDISIVEYRNREPEVGSVTLGAELMFKDSSTVAGDRLVKHIIESVLLPTIGVVCNDERQRQEFVSILRAAARNEVETEEWSRISRLVFLPIVQQWLKDLIQNRQGKENGEAWTPEEAGVLPENIDRFNKKCVSINEEILRLREPLPPLPSYDALNVSVRETLSALFASMAKYVAAFDCDLVIVTGKPSEIPEVRRLLEASLPILPMRIIFAKDFWAGDWYPLTRDGRITDAKTVTAVGAALYQAIKNGRIDRWSIERSTSRHLLVRNWWGSMPAPNYPTRFSQLYLSPEDKEKKCKIQINTFIGRKLLASASQPEQVYQFRWKDVNRRKGNSGQANVTLDVTLRRVSFPKPEMGESLELVNVSGKAGEQLVGLQDVELNLNMLAGGEFWMDTGRFEVRWPN